MPPEILLNITTPIRSIAMVDKNVIEQQVCSRQAAAELERLRLELARVCGALQEAAEQLRQTQAGLIASQREQIVRLSLEIASRILAKDVGERNYAIEKIVLEALQSAPAARQVTIRLNPEDLKSFEKAAAEQGLTLPPGVELAADWAINPAECVIDSELGVVESLIEDHLKQIEEALLGTGQTI